MLIFYKIKWMFHCMFNLHREITIWTSNSEKLVGCYECNKLNDKNGNEYATTRSKI